MALNQKYSIADRLIATADVMVRTLFTPPIALRSSPADAQVEETLSEQDTINSQRLMRVNHTGEICAQALYQGQALTTRTPELRVVFEEAANEEIDHLAWCHQRITTLGGRTSRLNPLFYMGSLAIGALASFAGDRTSAAFLAETEHQVVRHLDDHINRLPENDERSRSILKQMRDDELTHATTAESINPNRLPAPIRGLMRTASKVMTRTTYWI